MTPNQPEIFSQFERLLVALVKAEVEFAVVGGVAVSLNGFVRATEDVDIIVDESPSNIKRMLGCLRLWGEGWARELKVEEFLAQEGSIRVIEDFPLDIFTRMRGKTFSDFRPNARFLEISDVRIPYISPQDLIFLKENSWREKDQIDAAALRDRLEGGRCPDS